MIGTTLGWLKSNGNANFSANWVVGDSKIEWATRPSIIKPCANHDVFIAFWGREYGALIGEFVIKSTKALCSSGVAVLVASASDGVLIILFGVRDNELGNLNIA